MGARLKAPTTTPTTGEVISEIRAIAASALSVEDAAAQLAANDRERWGKAAFTLEQATCLIQAARAREGVRQ